MLFQWTNDKKFFTLLYESAANICRATDLFCGMLSDLAQGKEYAVRIKACESEGDRLTHELLFLLNSSFVTPLEREDILTLARGLDDFLDGVEAVASRLAIYEIVTADDHMRAFAGLLRQQSAEVLDASQRLGTRNRVTVRENCSRIKAYEKEADQELRAVLADLFSQITDPFRLIKLKEIYEWLEEATDRAEDIADTLESIVVKNS